MMLVGVTVRWNGVLDRPLCGNATLLKPEWINMELFQLSVIQEHTNTESKLVNHNNKIINIQQEQIQERMNN